MVNTASECGATPQYAGLEQLWQEYKGRGLAVLGFPSNDFGAQEPGTEAEIKAFCSTNYQVTFPLYAKVGTKGQPGSRRSTSSSPPSTASRSGTFTSIWSGRTAK